MRKKVSGQRLVRIKKESSGDFAQIKQDSVFILHCKECDDLVRVNSKWRKCDCALSEAKLSEYGTVMLKGPSRALEIKINDLMTKYEGAWHELIEVSRVVK